MSDIDALDKNDFARRLWAEPVFHALIADMKEDCHSRWEHAPMDDAPARERAFFELRGVGDFEVNVRRRAQEAEQT